LIHLAGTTPSTDDQDADQNHEPKQRLVRRLA
jgi:hypothetical protein